MIESNTSFTVVSQASVVPTSNAKNMAEGRKGSDFQSLPFFGFLNVSNAKHGNKLFFDTKFFIVLLGCNVDVPFNSNAWPNQVQLEFFSCVS